MPVGVLEGKAFESESSELLMAAAAAARTSRTAATMIAVQLTASHWLYPYAVWFVPLTLAAAFAAYRPADG